MQITQNIARVTLKIYASLNVMKPYHEIILFYLWKNQYIYLSSDITHRDIITKVHNISMDITSICDKCHMVLLRENVYVFYLNK